MKYTQNEIDGIRNARTLNKGLSQRALAKEIHENFSIYDVNASRTVQSIYGQVRKVDAKIAAEKLAEANANKPVRRRRARFNTVAA